ncbi:MAG: hypothetical protein QXQ93_06470 [Ignisphaera sp.]
MRALALAFILFQLLLCCANAAQGSYSVIDPQRALLFLRSQYVEEVGLLRAAVRAYPDNTTIYIANDNLLASRALAVLGDRELSSKILSKLNNEYSGGFNGKIEILLGIDIPDVFYVYENELVGEVNGYRIVYERMREQVIEGWYEYADLLVYRALDRLLWGSRSHAELLFLNLTMMWDGYGFRDKAFNATGVYATYKCALFIYLYRALSAGSDVVKDYSHIRDKCLEIIALSQDEATGGIRTDYRVVNNRIVIEGDVNVETTSIVILALYSDYPLLFSNTSNRINANALAESIAQITIAVALIAFSFKIIIKHILSLQEPESSYYYFILFLTR